MIVNVRPSYPKMYSYTIQPSFDSDLLTTPDGYYGIDKVTVGPLNKGVGYTFSPSFSDYTKSFGGLGFIDVESYKTYELKLYPGQISSSMETFSPSNFPSKITVGAAPLQKIKVVYPSSKSQKITPDDGYWAMSAVTVRGAKLETKNAAPITADDQVIKPSSGYYGLGVVNVPADSSLKIIRATQQTTSNNDFVITNSLKMKSIKTFMARSVSGIESTYPYAFYGNTKNNELLIYFRRKLDVDRYTFNDKVSITDENIIIHINVTHTGIFDIFIIGA